MHAAIDVVMRRNHIHHSTMGIWCDWEAQGTRITQNLLHDNIRPAFAKQLTGGMPSQDLFVEVSHGPTLIDNNILLSDVSLRFATQGVAMVHNLICGALTMVGEGTGWRYTPYHMPHRTEVMGFMTFLHGDNRFYNNIFVQKYSSAEFSLRNDSTDKPETENRLVGTFCWDEYPTYDEWIAQFDMDNEVPNMQGLAPAHFGHLPVWAAGNVYLGGAKSWCKETDKLVDEDADVFVEYEEREGKDGGQGAGWYLKTNVYDYIKDYRGGMIYSDLLGNAFEPDQRFENPDGTPITFDADYFGGHRGAAVLPGPFANADDAEKKLYGENLNV